MGKKYLETKETSLESSILGVWKNAAEMREEGFDGRTSDYKAHRAKLESARLRRENKKITKEEVEIDEGMILVADPKTQKVTKIDEKDWPKYEKKGYVQAEGNELDEATGKEIAAKMMKDTSMKAFASKVAKMKAVSRDDLEKMLPDYVDGGAITKLFEELDEGTKEEYEKFFNAAMKKFGIDSPADLKSDEEKKKFFDYVDKNYKGEKDEEFNAFMKEMFTEDMFTEEEINLFELDDEMFEAQMKKKSSAERTAAKKKRDKYMKTSAGKASAKKAKKRAAKVRSGAIKIDPAKSRAAKKRAKLYAGDLEESFELGTPEFNAYMKEMFTEDMFDMFTEEEINLFELDDEMFEAQMKKKSAGERAIAKKKRVKYMKTAAGKASAKKAKKRAAKVRSGAIKIDPAKSRAAKKRAKLYAGDLEESFEFGTAEYRDHTLNVTPGEIDPEWAKARDFKVASMKEALAKVWGLDEKKLDKSSKEAYDEEDEELKPVEGSKTMTGGKVAKVDTKPKID